MKRWSIQKKVIAMIMILGIVLVGTLGILTNTFFKRVVENQVLPISESTLNTLSLNVRMQAYAYLSLLNECASSAEIVDLCVQEYTTDEMKKTASFNISENLFKTNYHERIAWPFELILLCQDDTVLTRYNYSYNGFMDDVRESIREDVYYETLRNSSSSMTWIGVRDNLLYTRSSQQLFLAQNIVRNRETVGILIFCVDASYFTAILENGRISELSDVFLLKQTGEVIAGSADSGWEPESLHGMLSKSDDSYVDLDGEQYVLLNQSISFPDINETWELILLHPMEDLMYELHRLRIMMVAVGIALVAALLGVIVYINAAVLRPVVYYGRKVGEIGTDNYDVDIQAVGQNEALDLGNGLKTMVQRIQRGIVALKDQEKTLRKLEIQTLTAQINPHFIRNTLNSIRVMAEMSSAPVLAESIRTFTNLIDYIFHGNRESTVGAELSYLVDYVELQNLRWQHKFYFEVNVADELLDARIPALVFQPIVENCITHGFWGRKGSGEIRLSGWREHRDMVFTIEDDGVGIQNTDILDRNDTTPHGLNNIHNRIRLLYGEIYGLQIERRKEGGTVVRIRIPIGGNAHAENHDCG